MDLRARILHEIKSAPLYREEPYVALTPQAITEYVDNWLADGRNVSLTHGDDLALFDYVEPGVYSIHLFFQSRGKDAVEAGKAITRQMFDLGAKMIIGSIPVNNRKAAVIANMAGYRFMGPAETPYGRVHVYIAASETH